MLLACISSCSEPILVPEIPSKTNQQIVPRSSDDALDYFAKALAKAQSNSTLRTFLKSESSQNPWNDNCLVYAMHFNTIVTGSTTLADMLFAARDQSDQRFGTGFFYSEVFELYPTLSIYLYTGNENLDIGDYNTSIVTGVFEIPEDHTAIDSIKVYTYDYTLLNPTLVHYNIDAEDEPEEQYLCVGPNGVLIAFDTDSFNMYDYPDYQLEERVGLPRNSLCQDLLTALITNAPVVITIGGMDILLYDPTTILEMWCDECDLYGSILCNTDPGDGIENCQEECDRDCRSNRDQIVKYNFIHQSDLDRTCSWTRDFCRFQIDAILASNTTAIPTPILSLTKFDRAPRKNLKGWKGNWHTPSTPLLFFKWELDEHSDPTKYVWHYNHPKGGTKVESTVNYSGKIKVPLLEDIGVGGSTKIITEHKDIECGEDLVYYCDPANGLGTLYSTGIIRFYVKEQE